MRATQEPGSQEVIMGASNLAADETQTFSKTIQKVRYISIASFYADSNGDVLASMTLERASAGTSDFALHAVENGGGGLGTPEYPIVCDQAVPRLTVEKVLQPGDTLKVKVKNTDATNPHYVRWEAGTASTLEASRGN